MTLSYKYCCVIDKSGNFIDFVLVFTDADDKIVKINNYILKDGEILIDSIKPSDMVKPIWNGETWGETATAEEIEAVRLEPQIIEEPVSDLEIAFAEYVIETEQRLTELEDKIHA